VNVPQAAPDQPSPYPLDDELLQSHGTKDKLFIGGHYYSDKSPVPAFPMAAVYQVWRWCGGPSAKDRPNWFCLLMTWSSSGLAYVIAVCCVFGIGRKIGLPSGRNLALTIIFALGTISLPYAQQVNNHILLLAVAAAVFLLLLNQESSTMEYTERNRSFGNSLRVFAVFRGQTFSFRLGTLLGIGYTIDLAAGPLLCLTIGAFLLWNRSSVLIVILAATPWVAFHHIANYQIGGTLGPANAVPAYFEWSGSPFSPANMTGGWNHSSTGKAARYALELQVGKKGFLGHNLLLFLALAALPKLLRRRYTERPILIAGLIWATATWLLYAATSNNYSGGCCSIRWFVPLLGPGFFAIALALRDRPSSMRDAEILGAGSLLLGIGMAVRGPWFMRLMPAYWGIYGGTLAAWMAYRIWTAKRRRSRVVEALEQSPSRRAA
jgi:hypothetical protein